jgi:ABC-type transport system involved in multi-copper enzyme maturation permease subunit
VNPRITKEIRVLKPAFALTLAAAAMPLLIGPNQILMGGLLFIMGCVIMGAELFGNEFSQMTVSLLLSQPIPRTTIWKEKMQVLGMGLMIATAVFGVSLGLLDGHILLSADFPWIVFCLIPLGIFCTAPFWTLLYRNTLVGVLSTVVAPGLILGVNHFIHELWIQDPIAKEKSGITLLMLYFAACCRLGYDRFSRLQVVDAQSMAAARELSLPPRFEALLLRPFKRLTAGFTGPFASLMKKELRLQQVTFLFAAACFVVAFVAAVLRHWDFAVREGHDWATPILFGSFFFYLLVIPLIAGSVAVAEEKAWGVADWHLTLPPSVLKQWMAKVLVALGTSLAMGLLLPVGLALAGTALFGGQDSASLPLLHALRSALNVMYPGTPQDDASLAPMSVAVIFLFSVVLGQVLLTSVAIYAASIAANTARALVLAIGMLIVTGWIAALFAGNRDLALQIVNYLPRAGDRSVDAVLLLAAAIFLPTSLILRLAYSCFRARGLTIGLLRIQAPLLVLVVCFLAIAFVIFGGMIRTAAES